MGYDIAMPPLTFDKAELRASWIAQKAHKLETLFFGTELSLRVEICTFRKGTLCST